jgi:hypothetical protein
MNHLLREFRFVLILLLLSLLLAGCIEGEQATVHTNPDFSQKPGQEVKYVHSHPVGTTVRYDLNGDGIGENITVNTHEFEPGYLAVDGASLEFWSATPTGYFTVINVDDSGNELLVGVSDYGPSDDFQTVFYAYGGERITEVGYLNDILGQNVYDFEGAICHGDGTVTAKSRWDVLGSWNTVGLYSVDKNGVVDITDFYPYVDWYGNLSTWEVKAKVDIITYGNTTDLDMKTVETIPAGTRMRMTGLQTMDQENSFWVAFEVDGMGTRWVIVERIDWESYLHTGIGFVCSEQAFDGFYYAG